jgi:spore coat polysaccharide biosynthesis predicted glycosyltransferase SpsG
MGRAVSARGLRLVVRLTASAAVGLGHFVRCRALAEANRARGGRTLLVAEAMEPWLEAWAAEVFEREIVAGHEAAGLTLARWRDVVRWFAADAVVFDHYGVDADGHRAVRDLRVLTLAVDDVPERWLETAIVLNQNLGVTPHAYRSLVPPSTVLLVGPRYALIGDAVRRTERVARAGPLEVLVSFGGGAHSRVVERVLAAIASLPSGDVPPLHVTVVAPDIDPGRWRHAGPHPVTVEMPMPGLAPLLAAADVAIGAPGSTTYERLALGLPAVLVQLSDNQAPVARGLTDAGAALVLGRGDEVGVEAWAAALRDVCADAGVRDRMAAAGRRLVDGRGADRVLDALVSAATRSPAA